MEKKKQSIRKTRHENSKCENSGGHTTIFDDVFRTMKEKMPFLLIPLVNEVFGTDYKADDIVTHTADTHMTQSGKRITDACTYISNRCYHIECQSRTDNTIVIRMFEYDMAVALQNMQEEDGKRIIAFPHSAILYLRHNSRTKDKEELVIRFDDGSECEYSVPVVRLQDYTLSDIWEKQLYIMLPFYLLRYEKWLSSKDRDESVKECLLSDCREIYSRLFGLSEVEGDDVKGIPASEMDELVKRIANYILRRESDIKKEVGAIMGGQVLEFSWEANERLTRELKEAKSERKSAESRARKAEADYAALVKMIKEGRFAELELAVADK